MFEKLVESILVEYVSEWVVGLDAEKMKIALFGGKVEFRELQLKTSSLDKFQLPLTVKAGTLGRLSLKVPWKRLTKEAVTIRIEDLYLLVVPAHEEEQQRQQQQQPSPSSATASATANSQSSSDSDEDSYVLRMRWAKQQEVRVRELLEKNKSESVTTAASESASGDTTASWGYREKILHNIMDNVSFEFANIHIRYEDTTQLLTKNPLALGLTIDAITINTTNANGHVTFIDRAQSHTPFVHKILEIVRAGLYCDDTSSVRDLVSVRRQTPLASSYIIHPFHTSVKMTMNHDETTAFSIPKLQFVADIGSINASVTPDQCNDLISVINFVSTHELYLKRLHCRRKRPRVPVKRNAKTWWQYAFFGVQVMYALPSRRAASALPGSNGAASTLVRSSGKPACDWKLFAVLWRYQHEYIRLHKRMLRAAAKKLAVESVVAERCRLNELEDVIDVDSIVFFRLCAAQELELEETRHDSTKKLSNWKARWHARTHSSGSNSASDSVDAPAGLRALDPLEKLALYSSISEQMHASSKAIADKALASKSSQAIRFAVDVAIASIRLSLVEHSVYDSTSTTASTREFLQFELQQFVFAIFQRTSASSISSSIASIHMLDFSQVVSASGERLAQPLFYSLAAGAESETASASAGAKAPVAVTEASCATPAAKHFLALQIESTETKFALTCAFEPFRYVHNLSVAAKLQTYFVAQVDVSPALKENAEDALAYSSEWLNNAVFAGASAPSPPSTTSPSSLARTASSNKVATRARVVEFSIQLPEVDVLVLTTDTSPILQARLLRLDFKSGNLLDTFVFSLDGVTILFYDGVSDTSAHASPGTASSDDSSGATKLLRHQDGLKDVRKSGGSQQRLVQRSDFDLSTRKYSTILKKTRLVFHGEKLVEANRAPRWSMKCTAPPIYFTLSSAQYRQVLQASASWGNATLDSDATAAAADASDDECDTRAVAPGEQTDDSAVAKTKLHRSTSSFVAHEFDHNDERFGLCVTIPQILIALEGEDSDVESASRDAGDSSDAAALDESSVSKRSDLAIDLVLDIRHVNVEAKFSSTAQATAVDIHALTVSKRERAVSKDGKKAKKVSAAEALASVNEVNTRTPLSDAHAEATKHPSDNDCASDVREPDPVYDSVTGAPTSKLLEVGPKASFVLVSADPFKAKVRAQQVVLYWDQDLLVALFRSYLLDSSSVRSRSAASSRSSSRSSSRGAAEHQATDSATSTAPAESVASTESTDAPGLFGLDLHIERWYIYCRPHATHSRSFALKLHGRHLFGDISTLRTPYLVVKLHAKNGAQLESSRLVLACEPTAAATTAPLDGATVYEDDICELLSVHEPLTVTIESAGYGVLAHRTRAATYVHIHGSGIELNYVNAHFAVFADYLQHELIGFFNWVSVRTQPPGVVLLDQRTKIDAELSRVKALLPRGAIGNAHTQQRKPERIEMDVQRVTITSRPHPECPRMEQLQIQVDDVHISTCMLATELRPHTDAVASVDEAIAVSDAKTARLALERALAVSKTRMFAHKAIFVEYVALPIVESEKAKQRRRKRDAAARTVSHKARGFKDMDDVAREMEKLCGFVKVSLHKPADWPSALDRSGKASAASDASRKDAKAKRAPKLETRPSIDLALDQQQLALFGCILSENFAECELAPRARASAAAIDDEYMALDVQVVIGDVNLSLLASNTLDEYRSKRARGPDERALALVRLSDVRVLISGFSSERAQYRVVATSASLWNVDLPLIGPTAKEDDGGDDTERATSREQTPTAPVVERVLTSCAELYLPQNAVAGGMEQCIDITIDQHEPSVDASTLVPPQEIRVHIETCALTPSIVHFASRIEPFLFHSIKLPHYAPPPAHPVNVSVTTGAVHCMLAECAPSSGGGEGASADASRQQEALRLILSGCFVVRYSNADAGLQHVQLFGRKLLCEIAAQWPPLHQNESTSGADAPVGATSQKSSVSTPTLQRIRTASRSFQSSASDVLAVTDSDYRRVLCDDFAIDMDLIDTMATENAMKISLSLSHFHAVLCTFDVFMLTQAGAFDWSDSRRPVTSVSVAKDSLPDEAASATAAPALPSRKTEVFVNMILEDASVTFVREIGEYFTPVARVYTYCAMCKVRVELPAKAFVPQQPLSVSSSSTDSDASAAVTPDAAVTPATAPPSPNKASTVVEITLHFSEDGDSELHDDEGMSVWGFNTLLGSWEPIVEPWTFTLGVTLLNDHAGKVVTSIDLCGSNVHALSVNVSPSLLDSLCTITKEMETLMSDPPAVRVSSASVISCGFYLANDCGIELSYWVSDTGAAAHTSRGYSYAPRQKRVPELLLPRHKVPLKLSTALFHSLPTDQTVSFSWGSDDDWHPLTDVRIHSAGKYVYSVLPKTKTHALSSTAAPSADVSRATSSSAVATVEPPTVLLALFDISSVFGYRTLTVSSLVRVFNDTDVAVDCGILADDGRSVIDVGTIEPHDACGIPITLVKAIASVRVLVKPHKSASSTAPTDAKDHRWSNELFISEKEDCTEHFAACSRILDDYDCKCQRMFDGSQPLHVSQLCRANGSYFRVFNRMFAASNASSLRYSQMRVLPPLTFENKCGVALYVVVFVFKKVRRAGASGASTQDREYFHLVASEKIPPRSTMQFLASSLHDSTYCAVSMTGFSWSKLFLLPTVFPQSTTAGVSSTSGGVRANNGSSGASAGSATSSPSSSSAGASSTPSSLASSNSIGAGDVLCTMADFRARQATLTVAFVSASQELNAMRKVIIQPRFVLHNDTPLPLLFAPRAKVKSTISHAKAFFSLPGSSKAKQPAVSCCGSPQLELIHSKLNALNGATTTPASPTARSTVFKRSQSSASGSPTAVFHPSSFASAQEEMEYFYCSESNVVTVTLEGNTAAPSGVQQFRLDAAMGGANSSLRVFDESKKRWYDLVAILEQMDSYTTKVTFVERYLVLNRTPFAIQCLPACDIAASLAHGASGKPPSSPSRASPLSPSASTPADPDAAILQPSVTTSFNWCMRTTIPSDACVRLRIHSGGGDTNVAAGWRWSGKVSLHEVSETALKLSNKYTNQVHVLRVEVRVESSVRVYVVLTSEDTALFPLYRIINSSSSEMIHFKQSFDGLSGDLSEHAATASEYSRGVTQRLLPGESNCFGWDEAYFLQSLERTLVVTYSSESTQSKVLLDQPGEAQRVELPATKTKAASQVYLHWYLNGVTKTLHVHDTELPRDKVTGKQNTPPVADRTESLTSLSSTSGMIQLAATLVSELNVNVQLPNVLVSMLNSTPEEVLLLSAEKLELAYAKTVNEHDQCELKVGSFQLDNQLTNAVFPVIFTPVPSNSFSTMSFMDSPKNKARPMTPPTLQERKRSNADGSDAATSDDAEDDTFFHVSIFRLSYGDDVEYIKYLSAMLQPARLQIDDFLIISVAALVTDCMQVVLQHYPLQATTGDADARSGASETTVAFDSESEDASIAKIPPIERRMYIETLQLHPMKIHITFQQNNLSKATFFDDRATLLVPVVFMILKSNLVNIDSAALNLNALHIYHSFTTRAFMVSTIQQHYAFQGILQIYALVGAADILGNPIGLVTNLGTGVKDFFYEPVAGMVKSPQEFVLGLSRGTASLVKNSVYGTFNAASKFTGTLSSGIAALSMDSKYINERNTRNRQEVPTHLGTGLLYGTKQLGQGILAGVSGVLTAPAMGAYNNGLTGFVEGVGKGLIGVAVKPTAGILDLAARTTAGITATATVFDKKARNTRVRLPRMMHTSDKRLRVYSNDEAMISQLLHKLPTRLLQNEHYEAHVFLPLSRAVVATSHQFLHVDFSSLAAAAAVAMGPSPPRITWKCPLTSLWGAQKTNRGVSIMIGTATNVQISPTMTTLVTKSSMSTVLIPLRDTETAYADRVVKCVADLVARQRQRATPESETYAAPPPRNSIGLVLEPVRNGHAPPGYEGAGGQVVDVFVGSACFRAGVEVGDIIVGFGGTKFERGDHGSALRYQLSLMKKGDALELLVLRNGETKTINVATE